jgi:hypothetical protein
MEDPQMERKIAQYDAYEGRIQALEHNYTKLESKVISIEDKVVSIEMGQKGLETTVLKESSVQKDLLTTLLQHTLETKKQESTQQFELKKSEVELKKTREISRKEIWVAALGGGGVIGTIIGGVLVYLQSTGGATP